MAGGGGERGGRGEGDPSEAQTHADSSDAIRENAERKARALWKHRAALVRWTSKEIAASSAADAAPPTRRGAFHNNNTKNLKNTTGTNAATTPIKDSTIQSGNDRCTSITTTIVRRDLLSLVSAEGLGRHVVAGTAGAGAGAATATAIPAGTLLLREMPFAWCVQPEFADELCAHCLREVRM